MTPVTGGVMVPDQKFLIRFLFVDVINFSVSSLVFWFNISFWQLCSFTSGKIYCTFFYCGFYMHKNICSESHWRLKITFPVCLWAKSIYKSKLKTDSLSVCLANVYSFLLCWHQIINIELSPSLFLEHFYKYKVNKTIIYWLL